MSAEPYVSINAESSTPMNILSWLKGAPPSAGAETLAKLGIRPVSDTLCVSGQIGPEHMADLAAAGFKAVICNRPDGEAADQTAFSRIAEAAAACGIEARYLPVVSGRIGEHEAEQMLGALNELPKPALAYCRSGARSTMLWRLAEAL